MKLKKYKWIILILSLIVILYLFLIVVLVFIGPLPSGSRGSDYGLIMTARRELGKEDLTDEEIIDVLVKGHANDYECKCFGFEQVLISSYSDSSQCMGIPFDCRNVPFEIPRLNK